MRTRGACLRTFRRPSARAIATVAVLAAAALAAPAALAAADGAPRTRAFLADSTDEAILARLAAIDSVPAPHFDAAEHGTKCLLLERILQLRVDSQQVRINAIYRVDDPESGFGTVQNFVLPSSAKAVAAATWVLRDGTISRDRAQGAQVVKGKDNAATNVVIAIRDVQQGDIVGWSIDFTLPWAFSGMTFPLFDEMPVRRSVVLMATDGLVAYRMYGFNLRKGSWRSDVLKYTNGAESLVSWSADDLDAVGDGPFAPPPLRAGPALRINWAGWYDRSRQRWDVIDNWNHVAAWHDREFRRLFVDDQELRKVAVRNVHGRTNDLDRLEALRTFVHDRIVILDGWQAGNNSLTAADVLRARAGNSYQAGVLLFTLARAAGLAVRPVLAQSTDSGPYDTGDRGIPQFTDLLVESLAHPGNYFCARGAPGSGADLPPDLLGATAAVIPADLKDQLEKIDKDAWERRRGESWGAYNREFLAQIAAANWWTTITLPGDPAASDSEVEEVVSLDPAAGRATFTVHATQKRDGLDLGRAAPYLRDGLPAYVRWRFPDAPGEAAATCAGADSLCGSLDVGLPPATGDAWQIPAAIVYGRGALDGWSEPLPNHFYCPTTRVVRRVLRLAIPAGWEVVGAPDPILWNHPRVQIAARAEVVGDELVIVREWLWRHGLTQRDGLKALDEAFRTLKAFEAAPVMMARK